MLQLRWLFAVVLAVVLVACGDNGDDSVEVRTPSPTVEATQPVLESPTAEPSPGTPTAEATPTEPVPTEPAPTATSEPAPTQAPRPHPGNGNDAVVLPCNDILAPVDKQHRLPSTCVPPDLVALPQEYSYGEQQLMRSEAASAFIELREAAAADGMYLYARSSYRSYDTQVFTYNYHVSNHGQEYADRISARPGHSEHQLGTTTDVTAASAGYELGPFTGTPEAAWVAENSWRFGFIVSYPEGKEHITGYIHEPWHIRWVGRNVAADVRASGLTLGEYLHARR